MEINGYENYLIYEDGKVWSKTRKKFRKACLNDGYFRICLNKNNKKKFFFIHRLIALHYIPNPNNYPTVDHINRIRTDNRIENLRWATSRDQALNKKAYSNTGEKYISKTNNHYHIKKNNCFQEYLNCSKYTLQDAINFRDSLLSIEDEIVEPSV